jgi:hypothetical protein
VLFLFLWTWNQKYTAISLSAYIQYNHASHIMIALILDPCPICLIWLGSAFLTDLLLTVDYSRNKIGQSIFLRKFFKRFFKNLYKFHLFPYISDIISINEDEYSQFYDFVSNRNHHTHANLQIILESSKNLHIWIFCITRRLSKSSAIWLFTNQDHYDILENNKIGSKTSATFLTIR